MASPLREAVYGLKTVLEANTDMRVFAYPPDAIHEFPAAVIQVDPFDPRTAFRTHSMDYPLRVIALYGGGDAEEAYQQMYHALDPTEASKSIKAAVEADRTLDGTVTDASVVQLENMGLRDLGANAYAGFDVVVQCRDNKVRHNWGVDGNSTDADGLKSIPHGLSGTPTMVEVTTYDLLFDTSLLASSQNVNVVAVDGTNITVRQYFQTTNVPVPTVAEVWWEARL